MPVSENAALERSQRVYHTAHTDASCHGATVKQKDGDVWEKWWLRCPSLTVITKASTDKYNFKWICVNLQICVWDECIVNSSFIGTLIPLYLSLAVVRSEIDLMQVRECQLHELDFMCSVLKAVRAQFIIQQPVCIFSDATGGDIAAIRVNQTKPALKQKDWKLFLWFN